MASILQISKHTVLPAAPYTPSTMYLIQGEEAGLLDVYVSTNDGASVRHIITKAEITAQIAAALASLDSATIVADIAARDALAPTRNIQCVVLDATGDPSVNSGAATYIYNHADTIWYKISEAESQDYIVDWDNIVGKPTSAVADIDDAVTKRHTHTNKTVIDALTDVDGVLLYKGATIPVPLAAEEW